jgi:hypothetical protein
MGSLSTYDFLLGAMILCVELHHIKLTDGTSPRIAELFGVLQTTYDMWANHPHRFRETIRGAGILKAMLVKCALPAQSECLSSEPTSNGTQMSE